MDPTTLKAVSEEFLLFSALHHAAVVVVLVMLWIRRESMARTVDTYFAAAFATAAYALATRPETRPAAIASAVIALLWLWDAVRPRLALTFGRTPRLRLWIMIVLGLFGLGYPGYSGELPGAIFAPLGVILPPTVIVALAVQNSASPSTNRIVHWSLAATGVVIGAVGLVVEGWIHVPLVAIAIYAVALLLGAGRLIEERDAVRERSVREIRDRMYSRKTILRGPRDPRLRRRLNIRRRRR